MNHRRILAGWFYKGETIKKVVSILNANMGSQGEATRFEYLEMDRHEHRFDETIIPSIDRGLPVMLGWDTEDSGCHAVLVAGYWIGREKWLTINDPGGSTEVSWNSVRLQQEGRGKFEVGLCSRHLGPPAHEVRHGGAGRVPVDARPALRKR